MWHMGWSGGDVGGFWFLGMIFNLLIPFVFIGFLIWFVYSLAEKDRGKKGREEDDALEIVRKRYANGEITKDQFEEILKDLKR